MKSPSKVFIFLTGPLIPYRVTVVAVNLAGPGEQEMKDFFTREGGVCLIMQVVYILVRFLLTDEFHMK